MNETDGDADLPRLAIFMAQWWWAVAIPGFLSWIAFGLFAVTNLVEVHNSVLQGVYVRLMLLMSLMATSRYFSTSFPALYEYVLLIIAFEKLIECYILFLLFSVFAMWAWVLGDVPERMVKSRATYSRHFLIKWNWGALYGSGEQCLRSLRWRVAQSMVFVFLSRVAGFLVTAFVKPENQQLGRWLFLATCVCAGVSLFLALVTIFRFYRALTGSEPLAQDLAPADADVKQASEPRQGEPGRGPVQGEPGAPDAAAALKASLGPRAQDAHELLLASEQQPPQPPLQEKTAHAPRAAAEAAAAPGAPSSVGEVPGAGAEASSLAQPAPTALTDGPKKESRQSRATSVVSPQHTASLLVGMHAKRKFLIVKLYMWIALMCTLVMEPLILSGGVAWIPQFICPWQKDIEDELCAARFATYVCNWFGVVLQLIMLWACNPRDVLSLPEERQHAYSENTPDSTRHAVWRIFFVHDVWFMCARPPACCVSSALPSPPTGVVLV